MFRRRLDLSSYPLGRSSQISSAYFSCIRKWSTESFPGSSFAVRGRRGLGFPWHCEMRCFSHPHHRQSPLSFSPTCLSSPQRWYVYQPPGSREPNLPWFRSSATPSSSKNGLSGNGESQQKRVVSPIPSLPTPPAPPSLHGLRDAKGGGSGGHTPPASLPTERQKKVLPSPRSTSIPVGGVSPSSAPPSPPTYSNGNASPSSISTLWGTRAAAPPSSPSPSLLTTSPSPIPQTGAGGEAGWSEQSRRPQPVSSPVPTPPPAVPQWTGPFELRTPLEYILLRRGEGDDEDESGQGMINNTETSNGNMGKGASSEVGGARRPIPAADTMLHDLAALLIDPAARHTVEKIPLRTFVSMQPKRQLLALQSNKEWWEWIVTSAPYREVFENLRNPLHTAVAETTLKQDRRILKEAGLMTLQDWIEHQYLVTVSPQTKSVLDAAVTTTVQQHVSQVLSVVKQCHRARHHLRRWLSDLVGKFILDALKLSVEAAAVSVQKARGARWSARRGLFAPPATAEEVDIADYDALEEDENMKEDERAMATMMLMGTGINSLGGETGSRTSAVAATTPARTSSGGIARKKNGKRKEDSSSTNPSSTTSSSPPLRPGEVCTVEHYLLFLQKVTASVRQDRWEQENTRRSTGSSRTPGRGTSRGGKTNSTMNGSGHPSNNNSSSTPNEASQEEWEVQERVKAIVASAFSHLLQQAMQLNLPKELRELANGGYLALERVPVLLQRAAAQLQLRTFPVGYFIVHSTAQDGTTRSSFSSIGQRATGVGLEGGGRDDFLSASSSSSMSYLGGAENAARGSAQVRDFMSDDNGGQALPGAFLTDEEDPSIPLMLWKRPRRTLQGNRASANRKNHELASPGTPLSSSPRQGSGRATLYDGESLQESYYSMLFHLQSALEKLSFTTIEELFDDADSLSGCPHSTVWNPSKDSKLSSSSSSLRWSSSLASCSTGSNSISSSSCGGSGGGGICSSSSMLSSIFGESPLFGCAKLVEDQLTTAVSMPPSASTVEKPPLYFVEAGATCGKTALLERLQQRLRPQEIIRNFSDGGHSRLPTSLSTSSSSTRGGAVLIRYQSATTPFIPDLDDHPMAFAARFWFRVVLGTMPYFTRSELLYSRAPTSSALWWSNQPHHQHWSYQSIAQSGALPPNCIPSCVLVDDIHHVLDSMESKWARVLFNARGEPVPAERVRKAFDMAVQMEEEEEEEERLRLSKEGAEATREKAKMAEGREEGLKGSEVASRYQDAEEETRRRQAQRRREQQYQELTRLLSSQSLLEIPMASSPTGVDDSHRNLLGVDGRRTLVGAPSLAAGAGSWPLPSEGGVVGGGTRGRMSATLFAASRRQQAAEELQRRTGHSMAEILSTCMLHITAGMSNMHLVFAGQRVSPLLLAYGGGTRVVRQFHLPIVRPGSMNWQQRVRVLPPLAVLQALHRRAGLEMPGLLYEVIKNSPAFIGSTMELLWAATGQSNNSTSAVGSQFFNSSYLTLGGNTNNSPSGIHHNISTRGDGVGEKGLSGSSSSSYLLHRLLLKQYDAQNLFLELPLRNRLLRHPQHACQRLVELLQRQLCSPNGYLTTLVDTSLEDTEMGLVMPHSHTFSQVHPLALFIIFSHQATLQQQHAPSSSLLSSFQHKNTSGDSSNRVEQEDSQGNLTACNPSSSGSSTEQQQIVQAWTEVWAEYKETVQCMATTPSRKKEALRVLLHGALLLRAAALSRTEMNLNCTVPPYGFPLLASDMRVRPGRSLPSAATASFAALRRHQEDESAMEIRAATRGTVKRAATAYKQFFAQAVQSNGHFAFRPVVGLNAGCDVVLLSGHTLYLYDIAISSNQLGRVIQRRFAEALLGVLHLFEKQIISRDHIHQVQYVTVVCCDQEEEPGYYRQYDGNGIVGNGNPADRLQSQGRPLLSRSYSSLFSSSSYSSSSFNRTLGVGGQEELAEDREMGMQFSSSSPGSSSGDYSSFALQRPDNAGAAVPLILDYSALLDDDTMDILQYLRREVLGMGGKANTQPEGNNGAEAFANVEQEEGKKSDEGENEEERGSTVAAGQQHYNVYTEESFRTVQDLLDALEQEFRLPVRQRVLSTFEELEALFSPTLLQLIPDSMLLPPFTPAVVSSEDLLREVLQQQQEEENTMEGDIAGEGSDLFMSSSSSSGRQDNGGVGAEWEDLEEDQFLAQEQVAMGHASSSPENPFLADQELLESTDLLEAMMNDDDGCNENTELHNANAVQMSENDFSSSSGGGDSNSMSHTPPGELREGRRGEGMNPGGTEGGRNGGPSYPTPSSSTPAMHSRGTSPTSPTSTSPNASKEDSFSWLHQAIPQAASSTGYEGARSTSGGPQQQQQPSSSATPGASVSTVGIPETLPFPYTAAPSSMMQQQHSQGYSNQQDIQTAQNFLQMGGYNAAALPTYDSQEEMNRDNGVIRSEEGERKSRDNDRFHRDWAPSSGKEAVPPSQSNAPLQPTSNSDSTQQNLENEEDDENIDNDSEEDEEEDEWEEEEVDEDVEEEREKEARIVSEVSKRKGFGSAQEDGGRGVLTAARTAREGSPTSAQQVKEGERWIEELKALTRKSERGVSLSSGERRRLRRLRRRRLASAASGGKDNKLTVAVALRLRQQQKKENGEKKGVSSITGMSYDEEARFLERFLADERRRQQQQQQRQRGGGGSGGVLKKKKKFSSGMKDKKKILKKRSSKHETGKAGSGGSSASSFKKSVRSTRSSSSMRPARQPKRFKRA